MEYIVLCDEDGQPTGTAEKLSAHHAHTQRHLAFSCYVFDESDRLLVTKRADTKKVWPGVWTNSCCGHPGPGESTDDAIRRRLDQELGMEAGSITPILPDYKYETPPYKGIIEREFCPVYFARAARQPVPNPAEVSEYKWVSWQEFVHDAKEDEDDTYSWWCKDQVRLLEGHPLAAAYLRS
jgi:isopentenyl-diphosphate Delta-isomerase